MLMDEPSPVLKSSPKPKASFLSSLFSWTSSDKNKDKNRKVPEAVPDVVPDVLVRKHKRKMMARLEREEVVDEMMVFEAMPMKKCAMAAPKMKMAAGMPEAKEASKDVFLDEFV